MARKSLVLNGFLGGINEDGDLSDLQSEDRQGRNELSVCEDALCNQPGKLRTKRPKVLAPGGGDGLSSGDGSAPFGAASTTADDFLIHGTTYHRQKGLYKLGEDIEYSGKNEIRKPLEQDFGTNSSRKNIEDDSIGMNAFGEYSGEDIDYLFLGAMATANSTASAMIATGNQTKTSTSIIPATSGNANYNFVKWEYDVGNDQKWGGPYWNTFQKMGVWHATPSATVAFWEEGGTDPHGGNDIYGWEIKDGTSGAIVEQGGSSTLTADADIADADYIRFGKNGSTDDDHDIGVIFRVGRGTVNSASDIHPGLYGDELNITDKDIMIEIHFNGDTDASASNYGAGSFWTNLEALNITADSNGANNSIYYSGDGFEDNTRTWEISREQLVSYGANVDSGNTNGTDGGVRFKIPWDSAIHTGASFSSSSVKQVAVVLIGDDMQAPNHTDPKTIWVARLFEISFQTASTVGWSNTSTKFSQTRLYESSAGNKVESLLQPYISTLTLAGETSMKLELYQPNTSNYNGRLYYQEADDAGNGIGSLFLLAEVSRNKGVKSILSDFYQKWESFSITGCTVTRGDTNTVTVVSDTSNLRVGMRVYSASISGFLVADDVYIAGGITSSGFNLSTSVAGVASTSHTLYFDGIVRMSFSDPPISETYQLSAGYPQDTETMNALWDHTAVVGRQIYIGSVIKTGDDLNMESTVGTPPIEDYPTIDTISYSGGSTKTLHIKISDASEDEYMYKFDSGSYSSAMDIAALGVWQNVNTSSPELADDIKIKFPAAYNYNDNDAWTITITKEIDLILKSAIGKRYGFSNLDYIDLELPGTGITAMQAGGDRLFVFSASQLNVINVAQDYEFLEATMQGHGVASPLQVVEVNEGIAFVNNTGVYYFDGNKMENLSDDLMMTFNSANNGWADATNIGYLPEEKLICVWYDYGGGSTGDTIIAYSLATKAWVSVSRTNVAPDTRIRFYNNIAYWLTSTTLTKLTIADTDATTVDIQTGKISCGDLSRYKKFVKALVTCNTAKLNIFYSIDGESFGYEAASADGTKDISIGKKGKTIRFRITSDGSLGAGTEISDITLVYRDLRID